MALKQALTLEMIPMMVSYGAFSCGGKRLKLVQAQKIWMMAKEKLFEFLTT